MPLISFILFFVFAVLRVQGEKGQAFQALAHFYVAYLFTSAVYDRKCRVWFLVLGFGITGVEVLAFFLKG